MEQTRYGLRVELPIGYERAIELTTAALKDQGFGVLTTIDVQQTLKQKLDREFRKYVILGACIRRWPIARCTRNWKSVCSCPAT